MCIIITSSRSAVNLGKRLGFEIWRSVQYYGQTSSFGLKLLSGDNECQRSSQLSNLQLYARRVEHSLLANCWKTRIHQRRDGGVVLSPAQTHLSLLHCMLIAAL